ncbi:MAG: lysophospholipid acyltransferase family protein [Verrucomicrobiota bacterium]
MGQFVYSISTFLSRAIYAYLGPVHVLHGERSERSGPFILASNHISHFDPPLYCVAARRTIDWMAMTELFANPWAARFFRGMNAFPTDRSRIDHAVVRTALKRLKLGRTVGIFPEGGIRSGPGSVLEGAPMRPGVASLAQMASVPVVPCVLLGTDRLYDWRRWLPWRRGAFWVAFGEPIQPRADLPRHAAREQLERELAAAFVQLYDELKTTFAIAPEDLPHTQEEREREAQTRKEVMPPPV